MHAVIFVGFMALLLRKLQLIVIGYDEPFVYPGLAGGLFAALQGRRRARGARARRLRLLSALRAASPHGSNPTARRSLVLSLIAAIMVTDLAFDGFRFALFAAGDAGHRARARLRPGRRTCWPRCSRRCRRRRCASATSRPTGRRWSTCSSFLVMLPVGEHFHIVTALPALFFRRGGPANAVPSVDLEKHHGRGRRRRRHARRRAHRTGPHLEGGPRRLHLHRVRSLQGRLPDVPHRQAAVA